MPDAKDVAQIDFDVPAAGRPWDVSDSALAVALGKSQGRAFVALKSPAAPRVSQTLRDEVLRPGREAVPRGTRAPITKAEITEGLQAIGGFKVVVRQYFNAFGIVEAVVEASTAAALRADPHVDFVEPIVDDWQMNEPAGPSMEPPIGLPISMLSDSVPPGIALVGSPGAWPYTTGAGARLLLIDTGYDRGHPDLPNTLLGNCTHGQYGGCDDALPRDHGTHATGVIAGSQNGFGLVGVAPGMSSLDIYHWGACQNTEPGFCNTGEIVAALNWATTTLGARGVINISLATPVQHSTMGVAVSAAFSAGHLVVASTGNGGVQETLYPAAYTAALAVGAVNPDKAFPNPNVDFCNPTSAPGPSWGNHIDVVGPWFIGDEVAVGGGYILNRCGGTSMAAATVSGVAALIRARNPTWTQYQVKQQLLITAEDVHTAGWDPQTGWGLVRAPLAVAFAPVSVTATIVNNRPRLTWPPVPFATDYVIYSKITPICPGFQIIGTTVGTSYTDQSIGVTSFVGYDVPTPSFTAVSYDVYARSNGVVSLFGRVATYKTTLTNPPC